MKFSTQLLALAATLLVGQAFAIPAAEADALAKSKTKKPDPSYCYGVCGGDAGGCDCAGFNCHGDSCLPY
ncbi:unnamed protein product [Zymoseptoria tritici ST99CH_1A5]|nr:unnamed protein product [Zymoseptoria tritici ST99CH_1E4]SMR45516.1 unnamed protein product [Zymoseptoria tritici ST99CH_3D1]SMY20676.1 unnamed protein product [Zymoseptoria tritici ST99CH_1A5]